LGAKDPSALIFLISLHHLLSEKNPLDKSARINA
jgi:hypothetical protein